MGSDQRLFPPGIMLNSTSQTMVLERNSIQFEPPWGKLSKSYCNCRTPIGWQLTNLYISCTYIMSKWFDIVKGTIDVLNTTEFRCINSVITGMQICIST